MLNMWSSEVYLGQGGGGGGRGGLVNDSVCVTDVVTGSAHGVVVRCTFYHFFSGSRTTAWGTNNGRRASDVTRPSREPGLAWGA